MSTDYVKMPSRIGSGAGNLFVGPVNTLLADYADRTYFQHVGFCEGGEEVASLGEDYAHEGGRPLRLNQLDLSKRGLTIKFNIAEPSAHASTLMGFGEGTTSQIDENSTKAFTLTRVTLYGNRIAKLPYHNITVTFIENSDPTPTTWIGAAITTNFEIDSDKGTIKAKESGTVDPDDVDGEVFKITGTWEKPIENVLAIGADSGDEKNWYSVLYLPEMKGRYTRGIHIPKAYPIAFETRVFKPGESRLDSITFRSAKDATQALEWNEIEELD